MVKTIYEYTSALFSPPSDPNLPKPPPLPEYKPGTEVLWDSERVSKGLTPLPEAQTWPKVGDSPEQDDKPDWRGVVKKNVIEIPLPGKYNLGQPQDSKYFWFDTPDYADPFKKLWWSAKFFFKTGTFAYAFTGLLLSKKFTWSDNMWIIERTLKPWFVGGMVGSLFVITIANLRNKKDDYWNYALAGTIAGTYVGRKGYKSWFNCMLIWPPLAVVAKHNAETNGHLLPAPFGSYRSGNLGVSGQSADHGFWTGDLRFGFRGSHGDNGRDQRRIAH